MKLSIIIVNYNTGKLLKQCLESIFSNYKTQLSRQTFEVLVFDNASSDNSVSRVKNEFPLVKLITSRQNYGFAKANNLALKKISGKYILFLNPDTLVPAKTLTRMVNYLDRHADIAVATCKVILANGDLDDACHRGFPTPWRAIMHFMGMGRLFPWSMVFNGYHLGYRSLSQIHEIEACTGAFLLIRSVVGRQLDFFDEDYFWYGEDLDLCYRVKKSGYKIMFIPDVQITHYKGVSSGIKKHSQNLSQATRETMAKAQKSRFEVMRIFYRKHYQNLYPSWMRMLVFLGIALKQKFTEDFL